MVSLGPMIKPLPNSIVADIFADVVLAHRKLRSEGFHRIGLLAEDKLICDVHATYLGIFAVQMECDITWRSLVAEMHD